MRPGKRATVANRKAQSSSAEVIEVKIWTGFLTLLAKGCVFVLYKGTNVAQSIIVLYYRHIIASARIVLVLSAL